MALRSIHYNDIKTQKAKGYQFLGGSPLDGVKTPTLYRSYLLPQNDISFYDGVDWDSGQWFGRPCPVTPRHGFVESRVIKGNDDANALLAEARREDPKAELLIAPKLSGLYSGIATNVGVTWGMGNDGVTGNGSSTVHIPTPSTPKGKWLKSFKTDYPSYAPPPLKGTAYIELVEGDGCVHAVQYRDGPEQPVTQDYIPRKTVVTEVLSPDTDLLRWERTLKRVKPTSGVVVQLSPGAALSSHAAVHAIALGIPVVNSYWVVVGDTLIPAPHRVKPLKKQDYKHISDAMGHWSYLNRTSPDTRRDNCQVNAGLLLTSIATIHAMGEWDNTPLLNSYRAIAIPTIVRFMAKAALGELRHWDDKGPGRNGDDMETTISFHSTLLSAAERTTVYEGVSKMPLDMVRKHLVTAVEDFNHKGWIGNSRDKRRPSEYAYGGPAWAAVASSAIDLIDALLAFRAKPNSHTWGFLTVAANNSIHTAHNGGFALNKWVNDRAFKRIGLAPAYGFMNQVAAKVALGLYKPSDKEEEI